jgi:hypothetical protein
MLQNHSSPFIQNAVAAGMIDQQAVKLEISKHVESTSKKTETVPFCVLGPKIREEVSRFKVPKTRDLRLLANKMHEPR